MKHHDPLSAPCFLVGAERSGTTMLRLMLDSHPQLAWCSEFEFIVDHLTEPGAWVDLQNYYKILDTDRIFQHYNLRIDHQLSYPDLVADFMRQKQVRDRKEQVGATVHRHFDRLLWIWPKARFIHLVRDPRDVAPSCISMGWAGNVWTGVERWREAEELWTTLKSKLTSDRYLEVRYELLLQDPEKALTEMCQFLGLSYSAQMLSYPNYTTYDAPDARYAQKWKQTMKKKDVQLVEAKVAHLLVERGYQLSGHEIPTPSSLQKKALQVQDRLARIQARIKSMGLSLFVADYIVRRLGVEPWQRAMRLRLNEVEQAALK
ncbi:MAG: sulfotransferase [Leptolyngbya sp. DLM2.Bin15]|nr:MAG: sulfotransferase [Leptolyngbya sp. DLM2.Bin15]